MTARSHDRIAARVQNTPALPRGTVRSVDMRQWRAHSGHAAVQVVFAAALGRHRGGLGHPVAGRDLGHPYGGMARVGTRCGVPGTTTGCQSS
jgi:hypothetical protein